MSPRTKIYLLAALLGGVLDLIVAEQQVDESLKLTYGTKLEQIADFDLLYGINLKTKQMNLTQAFEETLNESGASSPKYTKQIKYRYESELHRPCTQVYALYRKSRSFFDSLPREHSDPLMDKLCRVKYIVKDCQAYAEEYLNRELYELLL